MLRRVPLRLLHRLVAGHPGKLVVHRPCPGLLQLRLRLGEGLLPLPNLRLQSLEQGQVPLGPLQLLPVRQGEKPGLLLPQGLLLRLPWASSARA